MELLEEFLKSFDGKIELLADGLNGLTKAVKELADEVKETRRLTAELKEGMQPPGDHL